MGPTVRNPRIKSAIGSEAGHDSRAPPGLEIQLPGTEFLDAETGAKKIHPRDRHVGRDRGTWKIGGKIPAETASFRSRTVFAVREDWVVVCAVRYEPVSEAK